MVITWPSGVQSFACGGSSETTNNRMEMTAAIRALEIIRRPAIVVLRSDSQYLVRGLTDHLPLWKQRGWKTKDGKAIQNQDLWTRLDALCEGMLVYPEWCRGHTGIVENELADALARKGRATLKEECYAQESNATGA